MKKIKFPNPNLDGMTEPELRKENEKLREHIELLEKEAKLVAEKTKRERCRRRKLTEASLRKMDRKRKAIAMRMRNIPVDVIADKLKISPSYAHSLISEAVKEMPLETAEEMKKLLTRTGVKILGDFQAMSEEGDTKSAAVMLKSMEKLMKLSGLDVEKKEVEVSELGNSDSGIDVSELELDLETKKRVLEAIRKKKSEKEIKEKEKQKNDGNNEEKGSEVHSEEVSEGWSEEDN